VNRIVVVEGVLFRCQLSTKFKGFRDIALVLPGEVAGDINVGDLLYLAVGVVAGGVFESGEGSDCWSERDLSWVSPSFEECASVCSIRKNSRTQSSEEK
jgi:hypothetical protein